MIYALTIRALILVVRLTLNMPEADVVSVAGSWDSWDQHGLIRNSDESGLWEISLDLDPGVYEYRFIINNTLWIKDPANPDYGGMHSNSILLVGFEDKPILELIDPLPGSMITKLPARISVRYHSGADNAPVDLHGSFIRVGHHFSEIRTASDDSTYLEAVFDTLPEGEVTIQATCASTTGHKDSLNTLVLVNCLNQKPVARTERVVIAFKNTPVILDGGLSYDPDGELLTAYRWEVLYPGLNVELNNPRTAYPRLIPTADRTAIRLTVSDDVEWSEPDTVYVISTPPISQPIVFNFNPADLGIDSITVNSVTVAGTWNGWRTNRDSLTLKPDGSWETELNPGPGTHEFQYCINGHLRITDPTKSQRGSNNILINDERWRALPNFYLDYAGVDSIIGHVREPECTGALFLSGSDHDRRLSVEDLDTFTFPAIGRNQLHTHVLSLEPTDLYRPVRIIDFKDELGRRYARNLDHVPIWSRDAIIAWLPRESFANLSSDLSYFVNLGVNTVWLPPVLPSPMEHGYAPVDHFTIDPVLGSPDELRTFIHRAHGLGMRVILDFVANHTSDQTLRFRSAGSVESQWHSWYRWHEDGTPHHWFHWDQLVNLNLANPAVRRHILASASYLHGFEVDGFRLDVAWALPLPFISQLRTESRIRSEDFLILGEVIPREPRFHSTALDMSYDTDFYGLILDMLEDTRTVESIPSFWTEVSGRYPPESVGMTYIENHDTGLLQERFTHEQCEVAGLLLFTWPGAPLILTSPDGNTGSLSPDLLRRLIALRNSYTALRTASIRWIHAGTDILAYHRPGPTPCIVIVNPSDRKRTGIIDDLPGVNGRALLWVSVLSTGHPPALRQRGSRIEVECLPWSGTVLVPEPFVFSPVKEEPR